MRDNYQDSLNAVNYYKGSDAKKIEAFEDPIIIEGQNEIEDYFWFINEGRTDRPLWSNNIDKKEKP